MSNGLHICTAILGWVTLFKILQQWTSALKKSYGTTQKVLYRFVLLGLIYWLDCQENIVLPQHSSCTHDFGLSFSGPPMLHHQLLFLSFFILICLAYFRTATVCFYGRLAFFFYICRLDFKSVAHPSSFPFLYLLSLSSLYLVV